MANVSDSHRFGLPVNQSFNVFHLTYPQFLQTKFEHNTRPNHYPVPCWRFNPVPQAYHAKFIELQTVLGSRRTKAWDQIRFALNSTGRNGRRTVRLNQYSRHITNLRHIRADLLDHHSDQVQNARGRAKTIAVTIISNRLWWIHQVCLLENNPGLQSDDINTSTSLSWPMRNETITRTDIYVFLDSQSISV
jgi:hypothetical protein